MIPAIPQAFVWRRLQSLMGLWLVLFLIEHLLVNSQAALLLGDNAKGFIDGVNTIHNLPYLEAIEIFLLGVPILIHMIWGIKYLLTSKPTLSKYSRNHAYTWQRITSWILVIGIIGHVTKFRFLDYPWSINQGESSTYFVRIGMDNGLYTLADRLGFRLYDQEAITQEQNELQSHRGESALVEVASSLPETSTYDSHKAVILTSAQKFEQRSAFVSKLEKKPLMPGQIIAACKDFGTASLLTVRNTFKSPIYGALYTIFVLAACFHAFNGLWTFLITWGVILKISSQKSMVRFAVAMMFAVAFLGLAAVWGTYWLNLRS